jgi:hypothetical protein
MLKRSNPTRRVAVLRQILDKFTGKNHIDTQFNRFQICQAVYFRQFILPGSLFWQFILP